MSRNPYSKMPPHNLQVTHCNASQLEPFPKPFERIVQHQDIIVLRFAQVGTDLEPAKSGMRNESVPIVSVDQKKNRNRPSCVPALEPRSPVIRHEPASSVPTHPSPILAGTFLERVDPHGPYQTQQNVQECVYLRV